MSKAEESSTSQGIERYREYLLMLARVHVGRNLQAKIDPSDVVQQTLLDAHRQRDKFADRVDKEILGWLRVVLAHNIVNAARKTGKELHQASLQHDLDVSSQNLGAWLAVEQTSPSHRLKQHEQVLRISEALAQIPDKQRDVLLLRHCRGWSLVQIAEHLGCTSPSVIGLLKRGSRRLREILGEGE